MATLTITELEAAINRCARASPPMNYVLGPDLRVLAAVYGDMIYRRLRTLELASLSPIQRGVLERWALAVAHG